MGQLTACITSSFPRLDNQPHAQHCHWASLAGLLWNRTTTHLPGSLRAPKYSTVGPEPAIGPKIAEIWVPQFLKKKKKDTIAIACLDCSNDMLVKWFSISSSQRVNVPL